VPAQTVTVNDAAEDNLPNCAEEEVVLVRLLRLLAFPASHCYALPIELASYIRWDAGARALDLFLGKLRVDDHRAAIAPDRDADEANLMLSLAKDVCLGPTHLLEFLGREGAWLWRGLWRFRALQVQVQGAIVGVEVRGRAPGASLSVLLLGR